MLDAALCLQGGAICSKATVQFYKPQRQKVKPNFMVFNVAQGDATKLSNSVTVPTSQGEVTYELIGT